MPKTRSKTVPSASLTGNHGLDNYQRRPLLDSNKAIGDDFEQKIAFVYEALGFQVTRNVNIDGHEIDIFANRHVPGINIISTAIEAKFHNKSSAGINDVRPFLNTAKALLISGRISAAALISNTKFTQHAKSAVMEHPGIRLMTLAELERELFNPVEALIRITSDYESSEISREYIPLSGTFGQQQIGDIVSNCLAWCSENKRVLIVVGDFGTGKTTIFERLLYELSHSFLSEKNMRIPIYFGLRNLRQFESLWSFISHWLREKIYSLPSQKQFFDQMNAGRFVFLLDGFDEIHTGANSRDRAEYLKRLSPMLMSLSPTIFSTRPTYFESFTEMTDAFEKIDPAQSALDWIDDSPINMRKVANEMDIAGPAKLDNFELNTHISINSLSDEDVKAFLSKHAAVLKEVTKKSVSEIQSSLYKIYDLEDLTRRPLLLRMIVFTILWGDVDITNEDGNVGPATLYNSYTLLTAGRDKEHRGDDQFLTTTERLTICRRLALRMLELGKITLSTKEVSDVISESNIDSVSKHEKRKQKEAIERASTDVRICTFLSSETEGQLRFAHKSFFEFFVAQAMYLEWNKSLENFLAIAKHPLNREIAYFLGSFVRDFPEFGDKLVGIARKIESDRKEVRNLIGRIVVASGIYMQKYELAALHIFDVGLRKTDVDGAIINRCKFSSCDFDVVSAKNWEIIGSRFNSTKISRSSFSESKLEFICQDHEIVDSQFDNVFLSLTGETWQLRNSKINNSVVILDDQAVIFDTTFANCSSILCGKKFYVSPQSKIKFEESVLYSEREDVSIVDRISTRSKGCTFFGFRVDASFVQQIQNELTKGNCWLSKNTGIFVCRNHKLNAKTATMLKNRLPEIVFLHESESEDSDDDNFDFIERRGSAIENRQKGVVIKLLALALEQKHDISTVIDDLKKISMLSDKEFESLSSMFSEKSRSSKST